MLLLAGALSNGGVLSDGMLYGRRTRDGKKLHSVAVVIGDGLVLNAASLTWRPLRDQDSAF